MGTLIGIVIVIGFVLAAIDGATKPRRRRRARRNGNNANGCVGCLIVLAVVFCVYIGSFAVEYVKAHSSSFVVAVVAIIFLGSIVFAAYKISGTKNPNESVTPVKPKVTDFLKGPRTNVNSSESAYAQTASYQERQVPSAAEIVGKEGEDDVSRAIYTACKYDKRHYRILRNVYIPKRNGEFSEIDVLLLHETGVYVFESKNLSGSIYGDADKPHWLRYRKNGEKDFIPNPIKQNEAHINYLRDFLKQDKYKFRVFSIIVFGLNAKLNAIPKDTSLTTTHEIFNLEMDLIKKFEAGFNFYNPEIIDSWSKALIPCTMLSEEQKRAHIDRVTRKFGKIN